MADSQTSVRNCLVNIPSVVMQQGTVTGYHCRALERKVAQEVKRLEFPRFGESVFTKPRKIRWHLQISQYLYPPLFTTSGKQMGFDFRRVVKKYLQGLSLLTASS